MKLPNNFPRVTVSQIFDLIDWYCESEECLGLIQDGDMDSIVEIPSCKRELLSETILNTYVESLSIRDDVICVWLADKENNKNENV